MIFTLTRLVIAPGYTLGRLQTSLRTFWTLEDRVREEEGKPVELWKIPGETAIPYGEYDLLVSFSNRFKKMLPILIDVPGFTGVRIHSGNGPESTEGCILVGNGVDMDHGRITDSRAAMVDLMDELDRLYDMNQAVTLVITK